MSARKSIAQLEAELAKAKAEIEAWKEAHAALARAIQPSITYVPYIAPAVQPSYPYPWTYTVTSTDIGGTVVINPASTFTCINNGVS